MALTASPITPLTVSSLERLYQQFLVEAKDGYGWTEGAIPFEMLVDVLSAGNLHAIALEDTTKTPAETSVVGFMLYRIEPHNAIEINLVYFEKGLPQKTAVDKLFGYAIAHWQTIPHWEVISFAMLGKQTPLIQTLTWYGFKPVGQCVMNLDLTDPLLMTLLVRQKQEKRFTPPDGLHLVQWLQMQTYKKMHL